MGKSKQAPKGQASDDADDKVNKPRNLMLTDATTPLQFAWTGKFRIHHTITVQQTPDQETWPGGAVWDLGWVLAQLLIGMSATIAATAGNVTPEATSTTTHLGKSTYRTVQLPARLTATINKDYSRIFDAGTPLILELGCGVDGFESCH